MSNSPLNKSKRYTVALGLNAEEARPLNQGILGAP